MGAESEFIEIDQRKRDFRMVLSFWVNFNYIRSFFVNRLGYYEGDKMSDIHYGKCEKCNYMGGLNNNLICLCCLDEKKLLNKKAKIEIKSLQAQNKLLMETVEQLVKDCEKRRVTYGWHDLQTAMLNKTLKRVKELRSDG